MLLWRLTGTKNSRWQVGESGELMVYSFSLSLKGWEPGEPMVWVPLWRPSDLRPRKSKPFSVRPEVRKNYCPSSKEVRQDDFPLTHVGERVSHFVLSGPSSDWIRPVHIKECNLLHSVHWFKCKFCPKTPSKAHGE